MKRLVVALLLAGAVVGVPGRTVVAQGKPDTAPNCSRGNNTTYNGPGGEHRSSQASDSLDKVFFEMLAGELERSTTRH